MHAGLIAKPEQMPVESPTPASDPRRAYVHPDFGAAAVGELAEALNGLLADYFAMFVKAKSFHWHVPGPNFREHHAMLDEHASAALGVVDILAERVRKLGGTTILSVGEVTRRQRLSYLREDHGVCEEYGDVATSGLLEAWIDQVEERLWHLHETCRLAAD